MLSAMTTTPVIISGKICFMALTTIGLSSLFFFFPIIPSANPSLMDVVFNGGRCGQSPRFPFRWS